jgi:hypothetical protein
LAILAIRDWLAGFGSFTALSAFHFSVFLKPSIRGITVASDLVGPAPIASASAVLSPL